jgi:hypothetical protein
MPIAISSEFESYFSCAIWPSRCDQPWARAVRYRGREADLSWIAQFTDGSVKTAEPEAFAILYRHISPYLIMERMPDMTDDPDMIKEILSNVSGMYSNLLRMVICNATP